MNNLVFIDTETTGLDPQLHQAYEVAWAVNDGPIHRLVLPHNLFGAVEDALKVGRYHDRHIQDEIHASAEQLDELRWDLAGSTLVGSNPAFDAGFLQPHFGPVWHHRLINVAEGAMWVFNWTRPKGLADVVDELTKFGALIPKPDHTAAGDVEATRVVYNTLRILRDNWL